MVLFATGASFSPRAVFFGDLSILLHQPVNSDSSQPSCRRVEFSKRRALAVSEALIKVGVASTAVKAGAFGQTLPAIMTADGVAEAGNRRVEILLGVK